MEPVAQRDLRGASGDDLRAHGGELAVHRLPEIDDALPGVVLEPGQIGALQEVTEQRHELFSLGGRAVAPVPGEGAAGHLLEVEETTGGAANLDAALLRGRRR